MARIAGVDLPREKRIEIGLTYIYGIGRTSSNRILEKANVNPFFVRIAAAHDVYVDPVPVLKAISERNKSVQSTLKWQ